MYTRTCNNNRTGTLFIGNLNNKNMIEFIQGKIEELTPTQAVVLTQGGVAYDLNISVYTLYMRLSARMPTYFTDSAASRNASCSSCSYLYPA